VGYVLEEFRFHKFRDTRAPYWLSIKSLSSRTSHGVHVYVAVKNANVHPAVYNDGSASGKKITSPFREPFRSSVQLHRRSFFGKIRSIDRHV